jgi:hypothetical protein
MLELDSLTDLGNLLGRQGWRDGHSIRREANARAAAKVATATPGDQPTVLFRKAENDSLPAATIWLLKFSTPRARIWICLLEIGAYCVLH